MSRSPSTPGALAGAATAAGLIAHQVAGKAIRDALFLSSFPASALPLVMAAAAALSLVAILALSRSMAHRSPATLMPVLFAASALGLVLAWGLGLVSPAASAVAVYLHTTALGPALISVFWSLVNERFDPSTAKRAVARIAAGGTLGGVLGALAAWQAASHVAIPSLVLFLAALHAACIAGALSMRVPSGRPSERVAAAPVDLAVAPSTSSLLRTTPMLRQLGLLVVLGAMTSALLDYVFSARAAAAFGSGPHLLSFFGAFWLAVSVVSFVLQVALGRVAIKRLGLATNIALLSVITILGAVFGVAAPGLLSVSVLRGSEAAHRNTLFRSAYEILYTPLTVGLKRTTKALIDVGFDRFGTILGSGLALGAVTLWAHGAPPVLLAVVIALAVATLPVAWRLHRSYLGALEQGMRDAAKDLRLPAIPTGVGRTALESTEAAKRDELIERVEALRPGGLAELDTTETVAPGPASSALRDPRPLLEQGRELLAGDVGRARALLATWPGETRQIAEFVILLLAHPKLHRDAARALRRVAPGITGQLVDTLLDPTMDFVVRRRIPAVLAAAPSQRAADGLLAGIRDERFEVRYACGRALAEVTRASSAITVPRESVIAAILYEREKSEAGGELAVQLEVDLDDEDPDALAQVLLRDRVGRSLEHVFNVLSLHLEREPLRVALRALHQEDARHRGTALEYLHTVLPSELRAAVWPLLGETGPLPQARPAAQVLAELIRATSGDAPKS